MADGQWHHVAVTVQPNATISYPEVILYLDGQDDTRAGTDPDVYDIQPGLDVRIGSRPANNDRFFNGLIDEVRIYNRTLSGAEIEALAMRPKAYNPEPADGAVGVANPLLSWQPRQAAVKRDVYLGTSADLGLDDLVADGSAMNMYWHAPGLEPGTTYYWRVDEIDGDGTVHIGDVWTFTATPNEAFAPTPPDGAPNQDASVTLSWMPAACPMTFILERTRPPSPKAPVIRSKAIRSRRPSFRAICRTARRTIGASMNCARVARRSRAQSGAFRRFL